jgi:hypothetical protein
MQLRICAGKDMVLFLGLFHLILLFMRLILFLVIFCKTIRVAYVYFLAYN